MVTTTPSAISIRTVVSRTSDERALDPAERLHPVAGQEGVDHREVIVLTLLCLLLLRSDHQGPEDRDEDHQHEDAEQHCGSVQVREKAS